MAVCKLCRHPRAKDIAKMADEGLNSSEVLQRTKRWGLTFSRGTWYKHLEHLKSPDERASVLLRSAAEETGFVVTPTTNDEFLETIRDIGFAQIKAAPHLIKPELALKAVQVLEGRKAPVSPGMQFLINITAGHVPQLTVVQPPKLVESGQIVEGEYSEATEQENQ